jgi:methyl-accepting chemotaxis protein
MAQKVVIDLEAKTDKAIKEIEKVSESITELNQEVVKGNKNTSKSLESVEKSANIVSKGIRGLGLAMKALGIGLLMDAWTGIKDIFSQNQRVVDVLSTAFETFSIVVNQVVNALISTYDAVAKSSENFNGLSKVLSGLMTISITPLKLSFFAIKLGIQQAQLAWEESFFGGKDNEKIKELNIGIAETRKSLLDTGQDAVNAGKDIYNNFSDAIGEIGNIANVAGENLSKISVKSALEQAKGK